ncbi:MAG: hypothetical protein K2Y17_09050 [Qipengyuania sp.]|nr:hypothetical protein [Qipengyuania sp.]
MADRVSASIIIGGAITAAVYADFSAIIADEGLSIEWDGAPFEPHDREEGEPLRLCAHEVAWGRFEQLEAFCVERRLPFARWSDAYPGQWDPERVVFTGDGEPQSYGASNDDDVRIGRNTAEALGSYEAIIANFDAADFAVPPLIVNG